MSNRSGLATAIILLAALAPLSGCLSAAPTDEPNEARGGPRAPSYTPGTHPWPRGDEWPAGLEGPFSMESVTQVMMPTFDGVELETWVYKPQLPEGVRSPVVLWSLPYLGQTYASGGDPDLWDNSGAAEAVPINLLVENGYVVVAQQVRGTGNSGGCFEMFGRNEQRDQAELVEWAAAQPWSNGRVGMMGLSYHGTTPWEAAIQNPEALKTIVVAGMISDFYTFYHSAQGAPFTISGAFQDAFTGLVSLAPPVLGPPEHFTIDHVPVVASRVCPEVLRLMTEPWRDQTLDERDAEFWGDRRLIDDFPGITTSILLTHGFQDLHGSGHQTQEDWAWSVLPNAPKAMLEGQWGHEFPNFNSVNADWVMTDWDLRLLTWLDFWLKGVGQAPSVLGTVEYQDGLGNWHGDAAWPPAFAHDEAIYLTGAGLQSKPGSLDETFLAAPHPLGPDAVLCAGSDLPVPLGLTFSTKPATEPILLAGNPFAWVTISADQPGGLLALHVYDIGPDFGCSNGLPTDADLWTAGVAHLRFHEGNFQGRAFPTNEPTGVRVDMPSIAEVLEPGHRLVIVASHGDPVDRTGPPYMPQITILGSGPEGSHIVLPVVSGTFGGEPTGIDYPPRPFLPLLE